MFYLLRFYLTRGVNSLSHDARLVYIAYPLINEIVQLLR